MLITKEKHSLSVEKLTDVVREQKKQHCAQTVTKISSDNNFFHAVYLLRIFKNIPPKNKISTTILISFFMKACYICTGCRWQ